MKNVMKMMGVSDVMYIKLTTKLKVFNIFLIIFLTSCVTSNQRLYESGISALDVQDYATAHELFKELADIGDAKAQYELGTIYLYGRGVEPDPNQSAQWYMLAAKSGLPEAQYSLGIAYSMGIGIQKNIDKAISWYTAAAKQKYLPAYLPLAEFLFKYAESEREFCNAFFWFHEVEKIWPQRIPLYIKRMKLAQYKRCNII